MILTGRRIYLQYGNSLYLPSVFVIADMHIPCALVKFVVASRVIGGLHPVIPSGVFPCPFGYIHMSYYSVSCLSSQTCIDQLVITSHAI